MMEVNKQSPYKSITINDKNMENTGNFELTPDGQSKRGGVFKRRLKVDEASSTQQSGNQSQVGKSSQVSRYINGGAAHNARDKDKGSKKSSGLNRLGSGRNSGSTSAATGSKNRLLLKQ